MACSRVPLITGELLQGLTRLPSIFVIGNGVILVLLFVGALGANGETRPRYFGINLTNVSSLSGKTDLPVSGSLSLLHKLKPIVLGCSERTMTTVQYSLTVFNLSADGNQPLEATCQHDGFYRPERVESLLHAECIYPSNTSCTFDALSPYMPFNASSSLVSQVKKNFVLGGRDLHWNTTVYSIKEVASDWSALADKEGILIAYCKYGSGQWPAVIIFTDSSRNHFMLTHGLISVPPSSDLLQGAGQIVAIQA